MNKIAGLILLFPLLIPSLSIDSETDTLEEDKVSTFQRAGEEVDLMEYMRGKEQVQGIAKIPSLAAALKGRHDA